MDKCKICGEPETNTDGIIELIDGKCEACRDHLEKMAILMDHYFDFSMN